MVSAATAEANGERGDAWWSQRRATVHVADCRMKLKPGAYTDAHEVRVRGFGEGDSVVRKPVLQTGILRTRTKEGSGDLGNAGNNRRQTGTGIRGRRAKQADGITEIT